MVDECMKNQQKDEKKAEPSFLDTIMENEYAQIFMSAVPGAILLCVALVVASVLNIFVTSSWASLVFLPIVCIFPLLAGLAATMLLRRVMKGEVDVAHCAGTGALSGFLGAVGGALVLLVLMFLKKPALGSMVSGTIFQVIAITVIVIMSAILSALGAGALAMFFARKKEAKKKDDGEE
jgi:hypothetical protein